MYKYALLLLMLIISVMPNKLHANFFYTSKDIIACQQKHKNPMDYTLCLDAAYVRVERELMTWETNLEIKVSELKEGPSVGSALQLYKASNKRFTQFKKATCQWQYLAMLPDVTSAIRISKECEIYMTMDRIEKLKELNDMNF